MLAWPDFTFLSQTDLFRGLAEEQWLWLENRLHVQTFPAGTTIVSAEQPGAMIYVILNGTVKIHLEQVDGSDVILSILGPGDTVGEMSVLEDTGRSASVVALEECDLLWIDRETFRTCLEIMPIVSNNLLRMLSRRLRQANERIQSLATLTIGGRVARQLLVFAQQYGRQTASGDVYIPLRLTQSDIAELIGASRVRVNQTIVDLKRRGYISVDGNHHMTIHDPDALAARCQWSVQPALPKPGLANGSSRSI